MIRLFVLAPPLALCLLALTACATPLIQTALPVPTRLFRPQPDGDRVHLL